MTEKRIQFLQKALNDGVLVHVCNAHDLGEILNLAAVALRYRRLAAQRQKKVDRRKVRAHR